MKRIILSALLGLASLSAQAELIATDWKVEGDGLATLQTTTGLEWIDLTETKGMSINGVTAQMGEGGQFEGWRFPTVRELGLLFNEGMNSDFDVDIETWQSRDKNSLSGKEAFRVLFTDSANNISGMNFREDGGVVVSGYRDYWGSELQLARTNAAYNLNYSHSVHAVWLVSDGGVTLSSINDPSINQPKGVGDVPVSFGLSGLAMLLLGAGLRKRA